MAGFYAIRNDGFSYKTLSLSKRDILKQKPDNAAANMDDIMQFSLQNTAMAKWWIAPKTRFVSNKGIVDAKLPDISLWSAGAGLVLSPKARNLLYDTISQYGELLPVIDLDSEITYWIFNCLTCSQVDENNSSYNYLKDTPVALTTLTFPDSTLDFAIFKAPYEGCVTLYCTDLLKDLMKKHNLTGVTFDENLLDTVL